MSKLSCRIRLMIVKTDEDDFEELKYELFNEKLLCSYNENKEKIEKLNGLAAFNKTWQIQENEHQNALRLTDEKCIGEEIQNIGWDGIREDIEKILENYKVEDHIGILATYELEWFRSGGFEYEEWDAESNLTNIQHTKMSDKEIEKFIGPFKRDEDGIIRFITAEMVGE